jgi:hypothetical protein
VWQDDSGRIGIVLVNWTSTAARWRGTFKLPLYPQHSDYYVQELGPGGTLYPYGNFTSDFTIRAEAGTTNATNLFLRNGLMAPRSVVVLVLGVSPAD